MIERVRPWIPTIAMGLAACGGHKPFKPVDLSGPWATATPASQNIDASALAAADQAGATTVGLRSLLVVRNGFLVDEQYFGDAGVASLEDGRSVTKSITSMLVGIAISQGVLPGTTEHLDQLIHPPVAQVDAGEAVVTVDNLLTMTGGFNWDESTAAGYNNWIEAPNQVQYVLDRGLSDVPGTYFNYNSGAVHLLSVGLTQASGVVEQSFATANLFGPLGIQDFAWEMDSQGFNNGAAGLALHPRDFAKLGQLVLQGGVSGTTQVVPADWVTRMVSMHEMPDGQIGPFANLQYGYLWWLDTYNGHDIQFGWGYRGQFVVVVPDFEAVVIATSLLTDPTINSDAEQTDVMNLIGQSVLPAIKD
jgi:CubicO group peptidase (beta-lactamase class C family)